MDKTKVYIVKRQSKETNQEVVLRMLKKVRLKKHIGNSESSLLIKPNYITSDHYKTGNLTSTDTLEGIILYLIEEAKISPDKLIVADGGSYSTEKTMKIYNVFKLEQYSIKVSNLKNDSLVNDVKIPNHFALDSVNIAKTAMDATCIIAVPSLKTHKNMMGTISP